MSDSKTTPPAPGSAPNQLPGVLRADDGPFFWPQAGVTTIVDSERPLSDELRAIQRDYDLSGYALFELGGGPPEVASGLLSLAHALGLGKPFVPPLYDGPDTSRLFQSSGVNVLTTDSSGSSANHPVFESRAALELHADGTLQAIGEIQTSMLVCVTPAADGGETCLFHAAAAFAKLAAEEPPLARAMADPRALRRHATVNRSREVAVGPVFITKGEEVISRYSTTPRDVWAFEEVEHLDRAFKALAELAEPPSPYARTVRLEARQGIVFANDRLAHGRTAFRDDARTTRHMLRALFSPRIRRAA